MQEVEARRYRITGVLGKGGFGNVYRATMEGAGGFHKNVAIKLLRDVEVPELTLQRFRDEARILGLVRDRAIVTVDPPTRLAGRWAVVMEYVDGASIQRLLQLGPIPASVTAEIVQEVARVLDKVFRTPGPDSAEPLRLLHRDIKPANLQLTPDGEVKVLDFGIAKAQFSNREAHTQAYVGGTKGFIAPERLEGTDGPEGDVFSLGVTAHVMLTGERPTRRQMMGLEATDTGSLDPDLARMLDLTGRMRAVDPAQRPTAREVEEECAQIRRSTEGPSLRRWAEENVAKANALRPDDEMVGSVLTETMAALPSEDRLAGGHELMETGGTLDQPRSPPSGRRPSRVAEVALWVMFLVAVVMIGVSAASFVLGGGVLAFNLGLDDGPVAIAPSTPRPAAPSTRPGEPAPPVPVIAPEPPKTVGAAPAPKVPAPGSAPAPAPGDPAPATAPKTPAPEPTSTPAPAPAPTAPAPASAAVPVTFTSVPLGAAVFIDGKQVGETPLMGHPLSPGPHTVKMVSADGAIERPVVVGGRNPQRYVWKGGEKWESHY